jgi:uncharacterized protein YbaR (Trm112 family)
MISQELLDLLRCPQDPTRQARLVDQETHLVCTRCGLKFAVRDGLPNMVVEEAELPPGCESRERLACMHPPAPSIPEGNTGEGAGRSI